MATKIACVHCGFIFEDEDMEVCPVCGTELGQEWNPAELQSFVVTELSAQQAEVIGKLVHKSAKDVSKELAADGCFGLNDLTPVQVETWGSQLKTAGIGFTVENSEQKALRIQKTLDVRTAEAEASKAASAASTEKARLEAEQKKAEAEVKAKEADAKKAEQLAVAKQAAALEAERLVAAKQADAEKAAQLAAAKNAAAATEQARIVAEAEKNKIETESKAKAEAARLAAEAEVKKAEAEAKAKAEAARLAELERQKNDEQVKEQLAAAANAVKEAEAKAQAANAEKERITKARKRSVYIILAIFFGYLGIHNFYAKRYWYAIAQFLFAVVMVVWGLPPAIIYIWAWIEIFCIKKDGKGNPFF